MTLLQTSSGSPVAIDCDVDASTGRVVLPKTLMLLLESTNADLNFTYFAMKSVKLDPGWEVEVSAPGIVNRNGAILSDAIPLMLAP